MAKPDLQSYTLLEATTSTVSSLHGAPLIRGDTDVDDPVEGPRRRCVARIVQGLGSLTPAFVEEDAFQCFIGLVIFLNIIVLWGETDAPGLAIWVVFDNIFLVVFLLEIILRLKHHTVAGFYQGKDRWSAYLDTTIVGLGIVDLWVTPLFLREFGFVGGHQTACLRFLRLMRLLRLLRVFRMFHGLQGFVTALWNMFDTFIWIFSVLFLFILCFAIMLTHLLGHAEALGDRDFLQREHPDAYKSVMENFQDVPTSLFTLFQLTTTDNWDRIAMPLVEINPWWRLFFVFFIAFASWTMISVLTAVASTNMIEATSDRKENQLKAQEKKHKEFLVFLHHSFVEADADGNGLLDKEEFSALMQRDFVHKQMKDLGIHLTQEELFKAWDMLDIDESGELTIEEFVTGLSYLQEGLSTKHIVNVDYSLKRATVRCEERIHNITEVVTEIQRQTKDIMQRLAEKNQNRDLQEQNDLNLWLWQQWALRNEFGEQCRRQLAAAKAQA